MRIGWSAAAVVHSVAPTLVAFPPSPSTHAIGVGHPAPPTTAVAEARSIFWFVNAGPPPGNNPSMITSRFTFLATSARPAAGCRHRASIEQAGEVRVSAERDDRDAAIGLGRQQPAVERNRIRDVGAAVDGVREPADQLVGVAVRERVRRAAGDGADRDAAVTVRGVDGVDGGDRHVVLDVGDDAQDPHLAALVQDVGDPDRGDVVPPPGQVGVDDDTRCGAGLLRWTAARGPTPGSPMPGRRRPRR